MGKEKEISGERMLSTKDIVRNAKTQPEPETRGRKTERVIQDPETASKGSKKSTKGTRRPADMFDRIAQQDGLSEHSKNEVGLPYDQTNYRNGLKRLEEKKKRHAKLTGQKSGEVKLEREGSKMLINGQKVDFSGPDSRRMRKKIASMTMDQAHENRKKLVLVKLMKKSKWAHMVRDLEINDDPVKRWVEPIITVDMHHNLSQSQKAMNKMLAMLLRCMILNPNNEPYIVVQREKLVAKLFELRKLCETEEDYEPIFAGTMRALIQTERRLATLQQGMGFSESEDSDPESCGEEALQELKNTRKTMQYTIASMVKGD